MRVVCGVITLCLLSSFTWALETPSAVPSTDSATTTATPPVTLPATRPTTPPIGTNTPITGKPSLDTSKSKAQQEAAVKALVKDQETRLQQLERANLQALAQNQELQLKNDNLGVQLQVLQAERSAQMFLYGAVTVVVGVVLGFLLAGYIYNKRRRQW
ncbi:hypothetical protein [uncultured Acinetobacter sp.]|uniref:hypothetical protein n=1 Tax=uncultured Acinetobacter sp. TaxID=165433 RepID=UPI00262D0F89|nr:hypothetical protein [uncultured Acinetobacter sp.]